MDNSEMSATELARYQEVRRQLDDLTMEGKVVLDLRREFMDLDKKYNAFLRLEADNLRLMVQATEPVILLSYRNWMVSRSDALHTDYDVGTAKYGQVFSATREFLETGNYGTFINRMRTVADVLAEEVVKYLRYHEAKNPNRPEDSHLYWLENWPLTIVESMAVDNMKDFRSFATSQYPYQAKISVRGRWAWLTAEEVAEVQAGRITNRLRAFSKPRTANIAPMSAGDVYPREVIHAG